MEFTERHSERAACEYIFQWSAKPHPSADTLAAAATTNATASERTAWRTTPIILPSATGTCTAYTLRREWHRCGRYTSSSLARTCSCHERGTTNTCTTSTHVASRSMGTTWVARTHQERRPRPESTGNRHGLRYNGIGHAEPWVSARARLCCPIWLIMCIASSSLYSTFITPWADSSAAHTVEPDFHLPACYNVQPPPPGPNKAAAFSDETLFFMFYSSPRDALQEIAAQELYVHLAILYAPSPITITVLDIIAIGATIRRCVSG